MRETLGVDSVALFELIVGLEDVYGITFEENEFRLSLFEDVESIAEFCGEEAGVEFLNSSIPHPSLTPCVVFPIL